MIRWFFIFFLFSTNASAAIEFMGDFVLTKKFDGFKYKVGGLSGLFLDLRSQELFAISDDSLRSPPRFYQLKLQLSPLKISLEREVVLKKSSGKPFPAGRADTEAITRFRDRRFLISSEGVPRRKIDPKVFILSRNGRVEDELLLPKLFLPRDGSGIQSNKALESLTLAPDESALYTANEDNLLQDTAEVNGGFIVRILEWKMKEKSLRPSSQFVYPLRKHDDEEFEVGLTELVSLGERKFLSLERGFTPPQTITGRIYEVDCSQATDVSDKFAIQKIDFRFCEKKILVDLNKYQEKFKKHSLVDNVEGMTLVRKGGQTYILVASDDNFRSQQVNQFLLFKWSQDKAQKKKVM